MAVCRIEKNKNYTTMANFHLRDKNLSNKARGLLSTMLSLPDSWDYTTRGLAYICKDGVGSITAQLKELEQYGYLERHQRRNQKGQLWDVEYIIYEKPHPHYPYTENPDTDFPDTVSPCTENCAQINIDRTNPDSIKPDSVSIDSILSDEKRCDGNFSDRDLYEKIIKENISYDILLEELPTDHDHLDEILSLLAETVCTTRKNIRIGGNNFPADVVRSRLLKLNKEHILFVFDCLKHNTTKIRNIRQYLLTSLYNAPTTISNYYAALVQHDLSPNGSHD